MELRRLTDDEKQTLIFKDRKHKLHKNRIPFDCDQLEQLCRIQCTRIECASVLQMSIDVLERRIAENYGWFAFVDGEATKYLKSPSFGDVFDRFSKEGTAALRRAQFKSAVQKDNTTMQIWLGKQLLGQKDMVANLSENDAQPVTYDIREKLYGEAAE